MSLYLFKIFSIIIHTLKSIKNLWYIYTYMQYMFMHAKLTFFLTELMNNILTIYLTHYQCAFPLEEIVNLVTIIYFSLYFVSFLNQMTAFLLLLLVCVMTIANSHRLICPNNSIVLDHRFNLMEFETVIIILRFLN